MMQPKWLSDLTQYMYNTYSKDCGKLLVHMGAMGWLFGSIAQISMLLSDKSIDKDQMKFLLPQEGADAVINVAMYYTICEAVKRFGDRIVEKGQLLTDDAAKALVKIRPSNLPQLALKDWKKVFTSAELEKNLTEILSKPYELTAIKNATGLDKKQMFRAAKTALKEIESHKNNVGIVGAMISSIGACNIVTPVLRNIVAAKIQKHMQNKEAINIRGKQIKENITMKNPLPKSFKPFNNYNSFSGIKI